VKKANKRAQHGKPILVTLSRELMTEHGKGFDISNLGYMRQFYKTYANDKKVSPLVTQLPWTHNLIILGQSKRPEEREFYLRMAIRERWGKRELERQFCQSFADKKIVSTMSTQR
jgi:predicted nuclease of restriction endonuclease-like (RecB) superfamily